MVVELTTTFAANLSEQQKQSLGIGQATYFFRDFRNDVVQALRSYYGVASIDATGKSSIKLSPGNGRLGAAIVPCIQYRHYTGFVNIATGITFWRQGDNLQVINFPKLHYDNGRTKNSASLTNGWYKPAVRLFKNARTYMINRGTISQELAPSYFLENLVYNALDGDFGASYQNTFCNILNRLWTSPFDQFVCQHGQHALFGGSHVQWNSDNATRLLQAFIDLWNNWS